MLATSKNNEILKGNKKYKGFCVDLLQQIAKICNFTYEIRQVNDNLHGSYSNITKKWNGLVGEIIDKVNIFFVLNCLIIFLIK
jgi:ionotropic glutamate receptor